MKYASEIIKHNSRWLAVLMLIGLTTVNLAPNTSARRAPVTPPSTGSLADNQTDMVLDWNGHAANAIVGVAMQPPPRGLIRLAMVHVAMYDAVNAIEGYPFTAYAVTPNVILPASPEAAAAAAAHDVLVALFPLQQADLDVKYAASLAAIPDDGTAKINGISVGQQAAAGILLFRADDGRDAVVAYV